MMQITRSYLLAVLVLLVPIKADPCRYPQLEQCECEEQSATLKIRKCQSPISITSNLFDAIENKDFQSIGFQKLSTKSIDSNAFNTLPSLHSIVFEDCHIDVVHPNALTNIKTAKFSFCQFEKPLELLSDSLSELKINNCNLTVPPNLSSLTSLLYLDLSFNKITSLPADTFTPLLNLKELYLTNNELTEFDGSMFVNNTELLNLDLSYNALHKVVFPAELNLETLVLDSCQLRSLPEDTFIMLYGLNELYLRNNLFGSIPQDLFAKLTYLTKIDLSSNMLVTLPESLFYQNQELTQIILDYNMFDTLPKLKFPIYAPTRNFSCHKCQLTNLADSTFLEMDDLVSLDLSDNYLTSLDHLLANLTDLKMVDLSNNQIARIADDAFDNNKNLDTIKLSGNPLKTLNPDWFAKNHVLKKLDVSNTQLTSLWSKTGVLLKSLQVLYASGNQISSLSSQFIIMMPRLDYLDLTKNAFAENDERLCDSIDLISYRKIQLVDHLDSETHSEDLYIDGGMYSFVNYSQVFKVQCNLTASEGDYGYMDIDNVINYNDSFEDEEDEETEDDMKNDDFNEAEDDLKEEEDEDGDQVLDEIEAKIEHVEYEEATLWSATSLFLIIALVVFLVTLPILFCILKNNSRTSLVLPHFKIPNLMTNQPYSKKHSGAVYTTLSEENVSKKMVFPGSIPTIHSS